MEGGNFYEDLLQKNLAVGYMKKLEAAVTPDVLIDIRTNYLMSCIASSRTGAYADNFTSDAGLSKSNEKLSPPEVNSKINEPVEIKAENQEVLSEKGASESDDDGLDLPEEVKFFIDSEHEESPNENPTVEEPKLKRLRKMKPTSKNVIAPEIQIEIEEQTTDLIPIENGCSAELVANLINNSVIIDNIFKHLPLTDLLNFRTVSTDWNQQILSHLEKKNKLQHLSFETRNIEEFISLVKSSKQIPFTKFKLATYPLSKKNIQELIMICGSSIKHLRIAIPKFTEKLSQFVPNLESLHLDTNSLDKLKYWNINNEVEADESDDDDIIDPIVFSKLTDIKYTLVDENDVLRTFFESTPNLNRLEVTTLDSEKKIVADLVRAGRLANITKLDLYTLGKPTFKTLFNVASSTGLFLEELCVNKIDRNIDLEDFTEFLSTQGKSLKKLKIQTIFQPTKVIKQGYQRKPRRRQQRQGRIGTFKQLELKNMIALTSLSFYIINDGICPQTKNALEDLPNLFKVTIPEISSFKAKSLSLHFCCPTVTKLVVGHSTHREFNCDEIKIEALGIMFPSVKTLNLGHESNESVQMVTTVWPGLKHLKFNFSRGIFTKWIPITCFAGIQRFFPSLLKLKDLETLSIFEYSMEKRFFVRFEKGYLSSLPAINSDPGRTKRRKPSTKRYC